MNVRQLRYFLTIARCGSFSRAASELNVAQPALSHHVANLEAELGVRLFDRSPKGVLPTECGETLVGHAEAIMAQLETARRDVQNAARNPSGTVSIGLPPTVSLAFTAPLVIESAKRYPSIDLRVWENYSAHLGEWLSAGRLDLAVLFDVEEIAPLETSFLFDDRLYWVCPPGFRKPGQTSIRFEEGARHPLLLTGKKNGLRHAVERHSRTSEVPLQVKTELDSMPAIKALVASGYGHTILPWYAVRDEVNSGAIDAIPIVDPVPTRRVVLARAGTLAPSRAAELIADLAVELMHHLVSADDWLGTTPELAPAQ
ncbi:MAG: LysR substrate-binding domain-containing protein [Acuticoccus sp.]